MVDLLQVLDAHQHKGGSSTRQSTTASQMRTWGMVRAYQSFLCIDHILYSGLVTSLEREPRERGPQGLSRKSKRKEEEQPTFSLCYVQKGCLQQPWAWRRSRRWRSLAQTVIAFCSSMDCAVSTLLSSGSRGFPAGRVWV